MNIHAKHDKLGRFKRKTDSVGIVDDLTIELAQKVGILITTGTINKKDGRVRLRTYDKFPGAIKGGVALRSRVVWWLNTGEVLIGHGLGDIHHINKIRTDDSFLNLEKKNHKEHTHHHNPKGIYLIEKICENCHSSFLIDKYRLKDPTRGKFCSQRCYHAFPKINKDALISCLNCGAKFAVKPSKIDKRKFCSRKCSALWSWLNIRRGAK
jgi:hypothetical protein